jgi:hypothetical protein
LLGAGSFPFGKDDAADQLATHWGKIGVGPFQGVYSKISFGVTIPRDLFKNLIRTTALA